jgi:hypothetical protein
MWSKSILSLALLLWLLGLSLARAQSSTSSGPQPSTSIEILPVSIPTSPQNPPTLSALPSSDQPPKPSLQDQWQEFKSEIELWGKDSDDVLKRLEALEVIKNELTYSLEESRALYATLESSTEAEVKALRDKIELLEELVGKVELKIKDLQCELFAWQCGAFGLGIFSAVIGVLYLIK